MNRFIIRLASSWLLAVSPALAIPVTLTSTDGRTREFALVEASAPAGLTVKDAPAGREILIPWERLDLEKSAAANPWLAAARAKAQAGATVTRPFTSPPVGKGAPAGEWRARTHRVTGGGGGASGNTARLALSAHIHRETPRARLAVVWIGAANPLLTRHDAADFVRWADGALVTAELSGPDDANSARENGEALLEGLTALLAEGKEPPPPGATPPAVILLGQGPAASAFAWSMVCHHASRVLASITFDGEHTATPNAEAFATPLLFVQTTGPANFQARQNAEDLTRPFDLWRHFSSDGCRWCFAAQPKDPLALAVAFARDTAAASPYQEVLAQWEAYENPAKKDTLPLPVRTIKDWNEETFRLASPAGQPAFPVTARTGAARHNLIWLPSERVGQLFAPAKP